MTMQEEHALAFFDALVRSETRLWASVDAAGRAAGSPALGSLSALRIIERHQGAARVQEVAEELSITVGAGSKLVDRLVRNGLVERSPNPDDRRSSLLGLTGAGRPAVTEGTRRLAHLLREAIDGSVSSDELRSVTSVLERSISR